MTQTRFFRLLRRNILLHIADFGRGFGLPVSIFQGLFILEQRDFFPCPVFTGTSLPQRSLEDICIAPYMVYTACCRSQALCFSRIVIRIASGVLSRAELFYPNILIYRAFCPNALRGITRRTLEKFQFLRRRNCDSNPGPSIID